MGPRVPPGGGVLPQARRPPASRARKARWYDAAQGRAGEGDTTAFLLPSTMQVTAAPVYRRFLLPAEPPRQLLKEVSCGTGLSTVPSAFRQRSPWFDRYVSMTDSLRQVASRRHS